MVGNVAGMWASLQTRGIPFVHIPSTFLAASDSVLSLKQAVNTPLGKNQLGLYARPEFVWTDTNLFTSLPASEYRSGLCELIKNGLAILPQRFFDEIEPLLNAACRYRAPEIMRFIAFCIDAKESVMRDDPHEEGSGQILEYGHKSGHAIETALGIPHGQAIGLGMLIDAHIAVARGYLSWEEERTHYELLSSIGAPTTLPPINTEVLLNIMRQDNNRGYLPEDEESLPAILLEGLGHPYGTQAGKPEIPTAVSIAEVRQAIDYLKAPQTLY
jgi:3-dehydroquinate synthase/2-deoxy-scyllo-inosose synthase